MRHLVRVQQHDLLILRSTSSGISVEAEPFKGIVEKCPADRNHGLPIVHAVIELNYSSLVGAECRVRANVKLNDIVPGPVSNRLVRRWPRLAHFHDP